MVIDLVAVGVFAVTGALVASRKQMDIIGFLWLGAVTGIGGGTVRDLLLGVPVFWVREPQYIVIALVASAVVFFTAHIPWSRYRLLLWLDAIGLALVSVVGTAKGLEAGVAPVVAVVMGVITAAAGGVIRDVLGQEPSIILRREIYVSAALIGSVAFALSLGAGATREVAAAIGFSAAVVTRGLAMTFGWSLPGYRARQGRTAEQIDELRSDGKCTDRPQR